ncbi:hypothetical protein D8674_019910 [Pyrus ussuriensis x Pyrus communis]|uniref:Uncharacterized protein n=1 Tax=Pyrus ussuriensis x Pyrus communis TaxID=2448454 RepID=A0A5N5G9B7_9ROSA|nr:hypothetical protein D8674_019910 [Pyrus ussuriensis x Pyrus communis]
MMNADRFHVGYGVLSRQMARELQMKEEEVKKKDEEEEEKKEEAQEGVEAKEPSVTDGQDVHVGPQPPPAADTNEDMASLTLNLSQWGWTPWRSKEEQDFGFNGDFSSGLGNPYGDCFDDLSFTSKIPVRPFDYRDEALFQMICILRMMAFIFYRIDDLPDYLIVWQLMKTNGKRASSKAGNKNSSERRMMMNADGFHSGHGVLTRRVVQLIKQRRKQKKWAWSFDQANGKRASNEGGGDVPVGPLPPAAADTNEVDMETVLGLSQWG